MSTLPNRNTPSCTAPPTSRRVGRRRGGSRLPAVPRLPLPRLLWTGRLHAERGVRLRDEARVERRLVVEILAEHVQTTDQVVQLLEPGVGEQAEILGVEAALA